jgi:hypothetical protein
MFAPALIIAPAAVKPAAPATGMKNEDAYHYSQQDDSMDLPF